MKWFKNPRTMEELRKQYRQLMKENHPEIGGIEEAAKKINNEYDMLFAVLGRQRAAQEQKEHQDTAEKKGVVLAFWRISPPPQKGSQFGRNPRKIRK